MNPVGACGLEAQWNEIWELRKRRPSRMQGLSYSLNPRVFFFFFFLINNPRVKFVLTRYNLHAGYPRSTKLN